jgi:tetratricopeptide (TPR) repeat protein
MLNMSTTAATQTTQKNAVATASATGAKGNAETDRDAAAVNEGIQTSFAALTQNTALDTLWNKYKLQKSPEVLAMAAQQSYRRNDLRSTLKYCQALAELDPLSFSSSAPPATTSSAMTGGGTSAASTSLSSSSDAIYKAGFIHVCTLVALNHKRALFRLAHEWVDASPKSSRAWFAVGAYYYACRQYHVAQRHFCRATRLDPHCPEAWIAFGASFSACDESDQALASFRAAQRLAPGHHVSLLYMGMEYLRTNHIVLAQHFLTAAYQASNMSDALCLSELGVMCCQKSNFKYAISWFLGALALGNQASVPGIDWNTFSSSKMANGDGGGPKLSPQDLTHLLDQVQDDYWEPTLFNLAQAYRRERQYDMAVQCLERALALKESANAYAALGFCLHLKSISMGAEARSLSRGAFRPGNTPFVRNQVLHRAIEAYHQSLAKKPEDPFCGEMLQRALSDALEQTDFFLQGNIDEEDEGLVPNMNQDNRRSINDEGMTNPISMPPRRGRQQQQQQQGRQSMDSTSSSFMSMVGHGRGRPPRSSTGEQSAASMASQWTEDGLSLSVESADDGDVDMS